MQIETSNRTKRLARRRQHYEVSGALLGGLSGAGMGGVFGGPPGAAVGAVLGAGIGALTAWAAATDVQDRARRTRELDAEIGVTGRDLGVPGLQHPPAELGAPSKASSGVTGSVEVDEAAGPITRPPE